MTAGRSSAALSVFNSRSVTSGTIAFGLTLRKRLGKALIVALVLVAAALLVGEVSSGTCVQEAVAQTLGLGEAKLAEEQKTLCPGDEVLRDQHQLEPHLVGGEGVEGEVLKACVLRAADAPRRAPCGGGKAQALRRRRPAGR